MITQIDKLLHPNDQQRIRSAIDASDGRTAVEVLIHIEGTARYPEARARDLARAAALTRSDSRQFLFLYLLTNERRCLIIVSDTLRPLQGTRVWVDVINRLTIDLLHAKVGQGVADAITRLSYILAGHFPAEDAHGDAVPGRPSTVSAHAARGR
jgi:uncharacterized membrane protein